MFQNLNFSTALHIMVLLELNPDQVEWMSSSRIAGSIHVNEVTVRRIVNLLKKQNLLISKEGKNGGLKIGKTNITLGDILQTLESDSTFKLNSPNPQCLVGKSINQHLTTLYTNLYAAQMKELKAITLKEFSLQF